MKVVVVTHRGSVEKVYVNNKRIENFQTHDEAYDGQYRAPNKKKKEKKGTINPYQNMGLAESINAFNKEHPEMDPYNVKKTPIKPVVKNIKQMKMWITFTPVENIDKKTNRVINNEKNWDWVFKWNDGIEVKRGIKPEIIQVKDISKDDIFLHEGSEYKILRMLSKIA